MFVLEEPYEVSFYAGGLLVVGDIAVFVLSIHEPAASDQTTRPDLQTQNAQDALATPLLVF